MDWKKVLSRVGLVLALACVALSAVKMFTQINTYGIDSFLLAGTMLAMAFTFKDDERLGKMWIAMLVVGVLGIGAGIATLMGL